MKDLYVIQWHGVNCNGVKENGNKAVYGTLEQAKAQMTIIKMMCDREEWRSYKAILLRVDKATCVEVKKGVQNENTDS